MGCKCRVVQLGQRQLDRLGAKVGTAPAERMATTANKRTGKEQQIPAGVDPAFYYPPGGRLASLGKHLADKVEQAPAAGVGCLQVGRAAIYAGADAGVTPLGLTPSRLVAQKAWEVVG